MSNWTVPFLGAVCRKSHFSVINDKITVAVQKGLGF